MKNTNWVTRKYFRKIGNMNWRFAVDYNFKDIKRTMILKRLSDTKITRYVKTQCDANPYDPEWKEYFVKRETYKMLISLKGRESLLGLWKKQKRVCPICNDPINKERDWYLASINTNGKTVKSLVHVSCCRRIQNLNKNKNEDFEPVS